MMKLLRSCLSLAILLTACAVQNVPAQTIPPPLTQVSSASPMAASPVPATPAPMPTIPTETLSAAILDLKGFISPVHDPVLLKAGRMYYLFSTGAGIPMRCSTNLLEWEYCGQVITEKPDWLVSEVPGVKDLWAPDISFYANKYHLYYSGSSFGSNRSAIGLATNVKLDQSDARYKWVDEGEVIASHVGANYNAIDPNLTFNRDGQPWLAFGSFWSGIKLVKIDPGTGKPASNAEMISIASNPGTDAIEGAFIVSRGEFFYLFVSHDFCCKGIESTYKIKVGRATDIRGPYKDKEGKPLLGGGGTLVYAGSKRWRGPGHNAIFVENDTYYLVYHAYDAEVLGRPTLRVEALFWDPQDWPLSPSALLGQ